MYRFTLNAMSHSAMGWRLAIAIRLAVRLQDDLHKRTCSTAHSQYSFKRHTHIQNSKQVKRID